MARIFLDANILIDFLERKREEIQEQLKLHMLFISPLSVHILLYIMNKRTPYSKLSEIQKNFSIIEFNEAILYSSLSGPTKDLEDNIQLHSAAEAEADLFLTSDKELMGMKFFGKTQIISPENLK